MDALLIAILGTICGIVTMKWIKKRESKPTPTFYMDLTHQTVGSWWFSSIRGVRKHLHEITINGVPAVDAKQQVFPGDVIEYRGKRLEVK